MSQKESPHRIPSTRIYLNAGGISIRVIDFVVGYNNPNINLYQLETDDQYNDGQDYENFAPFFIEIKNQPQEEINKFINQLALVYPIEVNYNYTPAAAAAAGDPKKQEKKKKYSLVSKKSASSSNNGKSANSNNSKSKTYGDVIVEEIVDEEVDEEDIETEDIITSSSKSK